MSRKPKPDSKAPAADALLGDLESIRALLDANDPEASGDALDQAQTERLRQAGPVDDDDIPMLDDAIDDFAGEPDDKADTQTDADLQMPDDDLFEKAFADEFATEFDEALEDQALEAFMRQHQDVPPTEPTPLPARPDTHPEESWRPPGSAMTDELMKALLDDEWRSSAAGLIDKARQDKARQSGLSNDAEAQQQLDGTLRQRIEQELDQWLTEAIQSRIPALRQRLLRAIEAELLQQNQRPNDPQ